jgi:hypothetical protein
VFEFVDELCYAGVKANIKIMNVNQSMRAATKGDVEEVAAGLNKELVRLENKVNGLENKMQAGFDTVLEELRGMRDEMRIGRQASRIESAELSQRMDMLEQEAFLVHRRNFGR